MKETIKHLKKVYKYGRKYRKSLYITIFTSIVFIIINIIYPIFTAQQLVNLTEGFYKQLVIASLIVLGFGIIRAFNRLLLRRNTQVFFRGTTKDIQMDMGKEILKMEISDIDKTTTGTFIQRLKSDTDEISRIFTMGMGHLTGILTNIGIFVAVLIMNKEVFMYYFLTSFILTVIHLKRVEKVKEKDKDLRKQSEKTAGLIGELVRGVRDIKMLNTKKSFLNTIEENIDNYTTKVFRMRNTDMNYTCLIEIASAIFEFGLIIIIIWLIHIGKIDIAMAIVLYSYKSNLMNSFMEKIGNLLTELENFNLSAERVFSILESKEFHKEKFGKRKIDKIVGNFEFKNVNFSYGSNQVLKKLSFKVKENETVAFVGKSGVGKTTIFNLLCKLYDIDSGTIKIDGIDINELSEDSIRGNITIINQNPYIFNMSIRENLKLVKENLTEEEMKEACKLACLDEYIESLPEKYDTVVGEGGVTLSGGQRQRLAIARAFIQNTKIILFDEATSALDNETQSSIQEAINNMKKDYTILIIAHRLSTVINADRIMLVEDGTIIDSGSHKELLKSSKIYKSLYESELSHE